MFNFLTQNGMNNIQVRPLIQLLWWKEWLWDMGYFSCWKIQIYVVRHSFCLSFCSESSYTKQILFYWVLYFRFYPLLQEVSKCKRRNIPGKMIQVSWWNDRCCIHCGRYGKNIKPLNLLLSPTFHCLVAWQLYLYLNKYLETKLAAIDACH